MEEDKWRQLSGREGKWNGVEGVNKHSGIKWSVSINRSGRNMIGWSRRWRKCGVRRRRRRRR